MLDFSSMPLAALVSGRLARTISRVCAASKMGLVVRSATSSPRATSFTTEFADVKVSPRRLST